MGGRDAKMPSDTSLQKISKDNKQELSREAGEWAANAKIRLFRTWLQERKQDNSIK